MKIRLSMKSVIRLLTMSLIILFVVSERTATAASGRLPVGLPAPARMATPPTPPAKPEYIQQQMAQKQAAKRQQEIGAFPPMEAKQLATRPQEARPPAGRTFQPGIVEPQAPAPQPIQARILDPRTGKYVAMPMAIPTPPVGPQYHSAPSATTQTTHPVPSFQPATTPQSPSRYQFLAQTRTEGAVKPTQTPPPLPTTPMPTKPPAHLLPQATTLPTPTKLSPIAAFAAASKLTPPRPTSTLATAAPVPAKQKYDANLAKFNALFPQGSTKPSRLSFSGTPSAPMAGPRPPRPASMALTHSSALPGHAPTPTSTAPLKPLPPLPPHLAAKPTKPAKPGTDAEPDYKKLFDDMLAKREENKKKKGPGTMTMGGIGMAGIALMGLLPMLADPGMSGMMQSMMMMAAQQGGGMNAQMPGGMQTSMMDLLQQKIVSLVQQVPGVSQATTALQDIRGGGSISDALLKQLPPDVQAKVLAAQDFLNMIQGKGSALQDQAALMLQQTQDRISSVINQALGGVQEKIDSTIQKATSTLDSVMTQPEVMLAAAADKIRDTTNRAEAALEAGKAVVAGQVDRVTQAVDKAQQALDAGLKTIDQTQQDIVVALNSALATPEKLAKKITGDKNLRNYVANVLGVITDISAQLEAAQNLELQRIKELEEELKQAQALAREAIDDTAAAAMNQAKVMAAEKFLAQIKAQGVVLQNADDMIEQTQTMISDNIGKALVDIRAKVDTNTQEAKTQLTALLAQPKQMLVALASTVNDLTQRVQERISRGAENIISVNTVINNMQQAIATGSKTLDEAQQAVGNSIAQALTLPANLMSKLRTNKDVSAYVDNLLGVVETLSGQLKDAQSAAGLQVEAAKKEFNDTKLLIQEAVADAATAAAFAVNTAVASVATPILVQASAQQETQAQANVQAPAAAQVQAQAPQQVQQYDQMPAQQIIPENAQLQEIPQEQDITQPEFQQVAQQ
ncbi:hypothetical protein K2X40_01770 [Candidatus Babeliales bacterium]|nr:hypothetical protein [Candidatus Babeliales bacterium]